MLDYYLERLGTLSTPLKSTALISQIISGLKEIRQKLTVLPSVSHEDVSSIQTTARNLIALIEGAPSNAAAISSTAGYCKPIGLLQKRQRPDKIT